VGFLFWESGMASGIFDLNLWRPAPCYAQPFVTNFCYSAILKPRAYDTMQVSMVIHMKASRVREAYTDDFYVAYHRDPEGNKIAVFFKG
jgi:hypothetical protein